jgi:hypothetical protein
MHLRAPKEAASQIFSAWDSTSKTAPAPATPLIVLGFDEQHVGSGSTLKHF